MGEELPDGTVQGYFTRCPVCGSPDVKCNIQGRIYDHDCQLCGKEAPPHISSTPGTYCNREKGHPGEHCRKLINVTGYHNIWW